MSVKPSGVTRITSKNISKVKNNNDKGTKNHKVDNVDGKPAILAILKYILYFKWPYHAEYLPKMVLKRGHWKA